jgi:NADPH:quinone reductase-like Zn-dependent oxidoreductase
MKPIQYSSYGGPELMRLDDFEPPAPGKGEVGVRVKFAAINPIRWSPMTGHSLIWRPVRVQPSSPLRSGACSPRCARRGQAYRDESEQLHHRRPAGPRA